MSERARIGFIGLGVMGSRMAATLARAEVKGT
jgi:3-hydroxyisobutyrate dehydrogenase-like beta-hydroxyacid dehydrogenase